jgi:hypothetical protein
MANKIIVSTMRVRKSDWGWGVHDVEVEEVCGVALMANMGMVMIDGMV